MNIYITTRKGKKEKVSFDKILKKLKRLSKGLDKKYVSYELIAQKTIEGIYDGVTTTELDILSSQIAASKAVEHSDYSMLASRIIVDNLHKIVELDFEKNAKKLLDYIDPKTGKSGPLIAEDVYNIIKKNKEKIQKAIKYERDSEYDYFAIKTLERSYLLKRNGVISETPQQMLMRVSIGIHKNNIDDAIETYELMSKKYFTHATPTLFNAGTTRPQMSSCFLVAMKDDSIDGIYDTLKQTAQISQHSGGIGIHIHNIRSKGSYIKGTGGSSNGIVPMLKNFNETAKYVDQGGGKRKGSFAMYLEPWHADIFDFLELKKNHGKEEFRARDLFYAMWIPDLFMKRVENDENWSLMDPAISDGLSEVYGDEFDKKYIKYELEGKFVKQIKARDLWNKIIESQIETGTPYMVYKDSINRKTNHQNLGVIKSSNLCAEIAEYSNDEETAVCNLASIGLSKFVSRETKKIDYEKIGEITKVITKNIDNIIDQNFYPTKETKKSNMKNRPIAIGVQGLADVFAILKIPFDSEEAKKINREIFETIYYNALDKSIDLAKEKGSYKTFKGSPMSKGILQFDMWEKENKKKPIFSNMFDWDKIRKKIKKYGIRNSLLVAQMPTASTSQILGNNESIEPFTSNIYLRRTLSGEFIVMNKYLLDDLIKLNLWNDKMKNKLMLENGSIQNIDEIPKKIKDLYKTVWEIPQKTIIDMASERGAFVDQTQSMNIHMTDPTFQKITSMHFYGWKSGLKTGMYYLRTQAARDAIKFTVKKEKINDNKNNKKNEIKNNKNNVSNVELAGIKIVDDDDPNLCLSCGA